MENIDDIVQLYLKQSKISLDGGVYATKILERKEGDFIIIFYRKDIVIIELNVDKEKVYNLALRRPNVNEGVILYHYIKNDKEFEIINYHKYDSTGTRLKFFPVGEEFKRIKDIVEKSRTGLEKFDL